MVLILAVAGFVAQLYSAASTWLGARRIQSLASVPPVDGYRGPSVSIVIAARNEERKVEAALRSVLAQRYDPLAVIFVDDRSTDRTAEVVGALGGDARLRRIRIDELPAGWLGKNHALSVGAAAASGELLLFMDADVELGPDAVARAVRYVEENRVDHLAMGPEFRLGGRFGRPLMGCFFYFFVRAVRPWLAKDPRSRAHVGVGAFNCVRRSAYLAVNGHTPIALRPDDDLKLGKLLKRAGFRCDFAYGSGLARVEWYGSAAELVRGLSKNTFSVLEYRLSLAVALTLGIAVVDLAPFVLAAVAAGPARWLAFAAAAMGTLACASVCPAIGGRRSDAWAFFPSALFGVFIVWRSIIRTLWRGGIDWRGTHYSLAELRANRV